MMEKVTFKNVEVVKRDKPWATTGKLKSRKRNYITSLLIQPDKMEKHNRHLQEKFKTITETETRWEDIETDDADYIFVAFGLAARVCHKTIQLARKKGLKVGLLRPITLWPFPSKRIEELSKKARMFLTVELNAGQMVQDVRLAVNGAVPVEFYGRMGGMIPTPEEILSNFENFIFKYHVN